jgi:hypothetical protein
MLVLLLVGALGAYAQFPAPCDANKNCIGQGVQTTVTNGRGAQYVDIDGQPIADRQTALTFEMWIKAEPQPGKRVYLGGLWGPAVDNNDVFILYIDTNNDLVFEVNGDGTKFGALDNTIVRTPASSIYNVWTHVAAVFDGSTQSVSLYIDGALVAGPVRNAQYPAQWLKPLERRDLPTEIGSSNGLSDDTDKYRTFKGFFDEVRIWNRALTEQEIYCNRHLSLAGNESGLRVYFRCNEAINNILQLCDATGNRHTGLLRSGATNKAIDRTVPRTVLVTPATLIDRIDCDSVKTYTFTIEDTSFCGSAYNVRVRGPEAKLFTITSPVNFNLVKGQPITVTVRFQGTITGSFLDTLEFRPGNRCGPTIRIQMRLTRVTELKVSRSFIQYDTLYVGCKDKSSIDSTITICNFTDSLGTPREVTINGITARDPRAYQVVNVTWPIKLAPGQCTTLVVRYFVRDTSGDYPDTLLINSTDRCQRSGYIAVDGRTQEVISIKDPGGSRRIDTVNFSATCPGQLSNPVYYTWQNLTLTPITIDTIIVPPDFTHYRVQFPNTLLPATGYQPVAIRFRPRSPGWVFDSIIIRTKVQGCEIERKIYVRGRGFDNKVAWSVNNVVDFGNVIVGQQRTINVTARNTSIDTLRVSLYVERGEAFTLLAGTGRVIPPGDSVDIPVTFRPIDSLLYLDRLCLFENRCYTVDCIELRGQGVLQTFRFSPLVMETQNVIGCGTADDTVHIVNISPLDQTLTNVTFVDQSAGRFRVVDPFPLPSTFTIAGRDSQRIIMRYTPNDVTRDRADRAFIRYKSPSTTDWQLQLIGTSATPKLYVTTLSAFGTLEVGDRKQMDLIVENTSAMPVKLDTLIIGAGFTIISTSRPLPTMLDPRDSIRVVVEFAPLAAVAYNATLEARSSEPCPIKASGTLTGRGVIVELESALSLVNFGYTRPCDCVERIIPILNGSLVHKMIVDSIWIDSTGIVGGTPQFYTWSSIFSPTGTLPYEIPPDTRDTIRIRFCPRTPAEDKYIDCRAMFHIKAHGVAWKKELNTYLAGKRSLLFKPTPNFVAFPPTRVDTLSPPRTVMVKIPGVAQNPEQESVRIDSISFTPDERVFEVVTPTIFPITIDAGDSLAIVVKIKPRAPRQYTAKLTLHFSEPCTDMDTTVQVQGSGFAPAFGLNFTYDPTRMTQDTFNFISCDTLTVPVYSTRQMPASVVDVRFRFGYDTTQLRFLDATSDILSRTCTIPGRSVSYTPAIYDSSSPYGGRTIVCKNFCGVDSLTPFITARFVTTNNNRVNTPLTVDSISFDTEDVIFFKIVAGNDDAIVIASKSELEMRTGVAFDSVRILDCAERTLTTYNIGDVPHTVDQLLALPPDVTIVTSLPALGTPVQPGDSAVVTLRFCPRSEYGFDSAAIALSLSPCEVRDTTAVTGYGYAPELETAFGAVSTYFVFDTLRGTIGDTVLIPLMIEKDVAATYNGVTYWLNGLSFTLTTTYNPYALKFLSVENSIDPNVQVTATPGSIALAFSGIDTLRAGTLAELKCVMTVPDVPTSAISVAATNFVTDSLPFLDVVPIDSTSYITSDGTCNITILKFSPVQRPFMVVRPNPVVEQGALVFALQETVPVHASIHDLEGRVVTTLLDGSVTLSGGEYVLRFDATQLPSGTYHVRLSGGVYYGVVPLIIAR